jgi:hypothetical protein
VLTKVNQKGHTAITVGLTKVNQKRGGIMTFTAIEKKTEKTVGGISLPRPSPRYAQMAAAFRAMGVSIKDDDYEKIDSLLEKHRKNEASKEADPADLLIISALLENNSVSQDSKGADPVELLIAGHLPQTKSFLLN